MRSNRVALAVAMACALCPSTFAQAAGIPARALGIVTVAGGQPTAPSTQISTAMEGIARGQIAHSNNACDSEDAPKCFPGLLQAFPNVDVTASPACG